MTQISQKQLDHLLTPIKEAGGYYDCPKSPHGTRLGPLVAYAGKYADDQGVERQYVGDTYVNFAKAEKQIVVLSEYAKILYGEFVLSRGERPCSRVNGFCGAPEGGTGSISSGLSPYGIYLP